MSAVDRYEWERLVRRCLLTSPTKLVALVMATYANRDGTGIYPGVARLTAVTGLSDRSVRSALKTLREIGLLDRTREGSRNGRRAFADEYSLNFPGNLLARVELLDPDESPAPPAGDGLGSPACDSGSPAPHAGTPAPGSKNTGTRCTPPTHLPSHYQHNTNAELDYGRNSRPRENENDNSNVIPLDRRAQ